MLHHYDRGEQEDGGVTIVTADRRHGGREAERDTPRCGSRRER
jgi:hypothetical protein